MCQCNQGYGQGGDGVFSSDGAIGKLFAGDKGKNTKDDVLVGIEAALANRRNRGSESSSDSGSGGGFQLFGMPISTGTAVIGGAAIIGTAYFLLR